MKKLYRIIAVFTVMGMLWSCDLDLLDDPNAVTPDQANVELLMNNVFIELGETWDEVTDETMGYVRQAAMTGSKFYAFADGPESFDFMWSQMYSTLLPDLDLIIAQATDQGIPGYSGVAKVVKAMVLFTLVDLFGDVPYSDALQGTDKLSPELDDDEAVYNAALDVLNSGLDDLANTPASYRLTNDPFYNGVPALWIKLGNTLKLRYYLTTRFVNGNSLAEIDNIVNAGNYIATNDDDFQFQYGSNRESPDSRHPFFSDGYETGGPSWYLSNYMMWSMFGSGNTEDPRIRYYFYRQDCSEDGEDFFTLPCQAQPYPFHWPDGYPYCTASSDFGDPNQEYGGYWGRDHGDDSGIPPDDLKRTAWGVYPCGGKFDADDCVDGENQGQDGLKGAGVHPIMLASWVQFMIAEAKLAGGNVPAARAALESGVRMSIDKVMAFGASIADAAYVPTEAAINDYVNEVLNNYDGAANNEAKLDVIMREYWIASHANGLEAYNGYRRTCYPSGMQLSLEASPGAFPRSFWYPASFVNRNENVAQKANVESKVFWDANPNGCTLQ